MTSTDDLLRAALTVDDQLDDIKRAQLWARLEPQLASASSRRRSWLSIAIAATAAAAVAVFALATRKPGDPASSGSYIAPRDTRLSLHVDDHTRAVLVGPAELVPVTHTATTTVVRLRAGTLLAEFEGGQGRSLQILAPGAVVEIVGTLFSVEARPRATCVSVAHGTVKMTTAARVLVIVGGQRACTDDIALRPIDPTVREALARHEAPDATPAPVALAVTPTPPIVTPIVVTPVPVAPTPQPIAKAPPRIARTSVTNERPAPAVVEPTTTAVTGSPPLRGNSAVTGSPPLRDNSANASTPPATEPTPPAPTPPLPAVTQPAPATPPPLVGADALYAQAERQLGARDLAAADHSLAKIIDEFPSSSLVDQALYERARIAVERRAWAAAQRYLDKLATMAQSPLAEPGAYLACRIAVEARDGAAADCFADYRTRYPSSPHDVDALGTLAELAFGSGGCARARARVDELGQRYPKTPIAQRWIARCPR